MPDLSESVQLIKPTPRYSKEDYQLASYRSNNGTVSIAIVNPDGSNIAGGTASGGGTVITVDHGTITLSNPDGTINTIDHGTITLSNPTGTTVQFNNGTVNMINAGTVTRLEGGTINNIGTTVGVGVVSMVSAGTITTLPNTPGGTINNIGTVIGVGSVTNIGQVYNAGTIQNIIGGTLQSAGTTTGVGVVSMLSAGTVSMINAGTINTGTFVMSGGTMNLGTVATHAISAATVTAGTIQMLNAGTISNINAGTIGTVLGLGGTATIAQKYASFSYISGAGTTSIKSSAGVVHCLSGTYTGNGTLYNATGTSALIIWSGALTTPTTIRFDVAFGSLGWAGTAASALTIVYT